MSISTQCDIVPPAHTGNSSDGRAGDCSWLNSISPGPWFDPGLPDFVLDFSSVFSFVNMASNHISSLAAAGFVPQMPRHPYGNPRDRSGGKCYLRHCQLGLARRTEASYRMLSVQRMWKVAAKFQKRQY